MALLPLHAGSTAPFQRLPAAARAFPPTHGAGAVVGPAGVVVARKFVDDGGSRRRDRPADRPDRQQRRVPGRRTTRREYKKELEIPRPQMGTPNWDEAGPPPDLPSLLLHNRIVYLGMPISPSVTQLIITQLLYLNFNSPTQPVWIYINSTGTTSADGRQIVGFETEAFAIADVIKYIKCPVHTVCIGQAFGAAALLLSQGKRGERYTTPNASIMLQQPRSRSSGQAEELKIRAKETLTNRRTAIEMIAKACRKTPEQVDVDMQRSRFLSPEEAVEYGLVDSVMDADEEVEETGMSATEVVSAGGGSGGSASFMDFLDVETPRRAGNGSGGPLETRTS